MPRDEHGALQDVTGVRRWSFFRMTEVEYIEIELCEQTGNFGVRRVMSRSMEDHNG